MAFKELSIESEVMSKYGAYVLYEYLISKINYESGTKLLPNGELEKVAVWSDLDIEFNNGILAVAYFYNTLAQIFKVDWKTIKYFLDELKTKGWIKVEGTRDISLRDGRIQKVTIYSLGTYILDESGKMIRSFHSGLTESNMMLTFRVEPMQELVSKVEEKSKLLSDGWYCILKSSDGYKGYFGLPLADSEDSRKILSKLPTYSQLEGVLEYLLSLE